jgi:CHC2 zinc finger/Toprim domain
MIDAADIEAARSISIASLVGGLKLRRSGADLVGACPVCKDGTDRFAVHVKKQLFNCRGCGGKGAGAIDYVMWRDGVARFAGSAQAVDNNRLKSQVAAADDHYQRQQAEKARWLWEKAEPAERTIVETYLRSRSIIVPVPRTIRFLPASAKHPHPCMISAYALAPEIEPGILGEPLNVASVHITHLLPNGSGKASIERPKITVGRPLGRPIAVAAPADGYASLIICEGVEDALTAFMASGQACWAAGSASYMPSLAGIIPEYFETITVCAHPDETGQRGARDLADRLADRGFPEIITVGLIDG